MSELVKLSISLILFMIVNILLGAGLAYVEGADKFDPKKLGKGALKALIIAAAIIGIYYAGTFVPDMIVINLDGQDFTTLTALTFVFKGAILLYAYKAFTNLIAILKLKTTVTEVSQGVVTDSVSLPTETQKDDTEVG